MSRAAHPAWRRNSGAVSGRDERVAWAGPGASGQSEANWLAPFELAAHTPRQALSWRFSGGRCWSGGDGNMPPAIPEEATADERRDWETWRLIQGGDASKQGLKDPRLIGSGSRRGRMVCAKLAFSQVERRAIRCGCGMAEAQRTFLGSALLMVAAGWAGAWAAGWRCGRSSDLRREGSLAVCGGRPAGGGGDRRFGVAGDICGLPRIHGVWRLAAEVLPAAWAPWAQGAAFLGAAGLGGLAAAAWAFHGGAACRVWLALWAGILA